MKNILITGTSGFIGTRLVKTLNQKFNCISYDLKLPNNQDLSNFGDIECIIHLAGCAHKKFTNDEYIVNNLTATECLINKAHEANIKKFIFMSTISVYGDKFSNLVDHDKCVNPVSQASITKLNAETYLKNSCNNNNMDFIVIRSPLVYGPGVKANFAAILKLASTGIPLPFGDITKNKRSMVYVDNLVDLIITCINHPNAANQTFLVSDDDDLSTARMIKELSLALGNKGWMLPVPVKLFEWLGKITGKSAMVERLCGSLQVDISKTKQLLDWQPPFSVKEGFAETAKNFLQNK